MKRYTGADIYTDVDGLKPETRDIEFCLWSDVNALLKQCEEALHRYGHHETGCGWVGGEYGPICTCGLDLRLAAIKQAREEK